MMQKDLPDRQTIFEFSMALLVLFVLLFFSYGLFVRAPYTGLNIYPSNGLIVGLYVDTSLIQLNDIVIQVGDVPFESYLNNNRQSLFVNSIKGDIVNILLERNGTQMTIPWEIPGFNSEEFSRRFFNIWWFAYVYWLVGFVAQLLMRPKNTAVRRLFIASFYLIGLWLMFGCISSWHLWEGSVLLHASTWILLPLYLHLHWIFPKPFHPPAKWLVYLFYTICLLLAVAEVFQLLPRNLYGLGFLITMAGSAILLTVHFIKQPHERREVTILFIAVLFVVVPFISFSINGFSSRIAYITFIVLPFIPLMYFYTIYRRQLGNLELRVNRLLSLYAFLLLVGSIFPFILKWITSPSLSYETTLFLIFGTTLLTVFVSILAFPSFQAFFEQRILGIKVPYQNLLEAYSNRITTSTSLPSLLQFLDEEVFPSLLIRQFAFLQASNGNLKVLLEKNAPTNALLVESKVNDLVTRSGKYIATFSSADEWIRLILPLKIGDEILGFWLLGRHDPDDLYSQTEISTLQTLANQTAIALSNILQTERLKAIYQDDINQYENERTQLALRLHDDILQQLAVLNVSLSEENTPPVFQETYKNLTGQLREIIVDLHPLMLNYGLKPAIDGLADNLMERMRDTIAIEVNIKSDNTRYQINNIEDHIFHMVQECCGNAIRHAQAKKIQISGRLVANEISLTIMDDGIGFDIKNGLEVATLHKHRHFGLAGILKRAKLIDANVTFSSALQKGTSVQIFLKPDHQMND
jgi:signal transduction histidine kinase